MQLGFAQLGLCSGSKGNPIFQENFGSGLNYGPQLPPGITNYVYAGASQPSDGKYTIYRRTNQYSSWHNSPDHTPDTEIDGTDGKCLIINASSIAGEFYKRTVTGLCDNTDFEFSSWVINLYNPIPISCNGGIGKPIDLTFEIWNVTETLLIRSGSTMPIASTATPVWSQYGLTFTTLPGQTDVVLKIKNNGTGGCGNDLALDDISFRACSDFSKITSPGIVGNTYSVCENVLPISLPLNLIISNTTIHVFQWQESLDNITWTNIVGETGLNYNVTNLNTAKSYRVKVAQNISNFNNLNCFTISEIFKIELKPKPVSPVSNGDKTICSAQTIPQLSVTVPSSNSVNWYDALTGGNLILSNSLFYTPTLAGTYYAESYNTTNNCLNSIRTPVSLIINNQQSSIAETVYYCEDKVSIDLDAVDLNGTYLWSTAAAETTQKITITSPGIYTVTITNPLGCYYTKTFTVIKNTFPVITSITTNESVVTINTTVMGAYEYSIDGINYQTSNTFYGVSGGKHLAYVRGINNCGEDFKDFFILIIPKFFTPNEDSFNDFFEIEGLDYYPKATVAIFDRYGKLLKFLGNKTKWDGIYLKKPLPSSDYWYRINLGNGKEIKGHFTLKR